MELLNQMYINFIKIDGCGDIDDNLKDFEENDEEIQYLVEYICESDYIIADIIPLEYDGKNNIISSRRYLDKNGLKYSFFTS